MLLGGTRADEVADYDKPGGDPDAHLQGNAGGVFELLYGVDEGKSDPNRALGVMLVRPRIAEIGEHAVAHVLGDKATGPR